MAIPVGVLLTAAEAVRNPVVQETARTIFGWLRDRRNGQGVPTDAVDVAALLSDMPTRAELALALSQIDVRIAEAERRCIRVLGSGLVAATVVLGALIVLV